MILANKSLRTVLITGAAGGIGKATVAHFAAQGWRVIGVDRKEVYAGFPADGLFIQADLALPQEVERVYREAADFTSKLDALVNNAAFQVTKPISQTSVEEWDQVIAVNLRAAFLGARYGFELLAAEGGGAIVNVASVHAVATSPNIAAYAASKGGLVALTRAMAIEFAPANIRVNAILPGAVDTPMLAAGFNRGHLAQGSVEQQKAELARKTVLGRIGQPHEIASVIYFLADSNQSGYMTGQSVVVDGGASARLSTE
jgi:NAD(P)-dependent dehydrogenase (short-subunit alcohol dehydrogenase family)